MNSQETARSLFGILYRAYHKRGLETQQRERAALDTIAHEVNKRVEHWRESRWGFSLEQLRELKVLALLEVREPAPRLLDAINSIGSYGGLGDAEITAFLVQFPSLAAPAPLPQVLQ